MLLLLSQLCSTAVALAYVFLIIVKNSITVAELSLSLRLGEVGVVERGGPAVGGGVGGAAEESGCQACVALSLFTQCEDGRQ